MKSPVLKRSIAVAGHKTGVSLEEAFWNGMNEISALWNMTLSELVGETDSNRQQGNLSSAIRLFVLDFKKRAAFHLPNVRVRLQRVPGSSPAAPTKPYKYLQHHASDVDEAGRFWCGNPQQALDFVGLPAVARAPKRPAFAFGFGAAAFTQLTRAKAGEPRQHSGWLPHQLRYPFGFANSLGTFLTRKTGSLQ